jgi:hypothetical protein
MRVTRADLAALGTRGHDLEPESAQRLRAAGLLDPDGALVPTAVPLANAVAASSARVDVTRATVGRSAAAQVWWGSQGVVVLPVSQTPTEVALQAPDALARTLFRLLQLGPRPVATAAPTTMPLDVLLGPFRGEADGWLTTIDVHPEDAVLCRLEVRVGPADEPATRVAIVDTPAGLLDVRTDPSGDGVALAPTGPVDVFAALCRLQVALAERVAA